MYQHILVALDGSAASGYAGQAAVELAAATGARVTACHVYGAQIHRHRFTDMEPGLPASYQAPETLSHLRLTHDQLIEEGFEALSTGYIEDFIVKAQHAGLSAQSATMEGRSFVGILHLAKSMKADLIVLGADGLGAVGNGLLGGTTTRVLQNAPCDVLIARQTPPAGPILTGVDGSEAALQAVDKAVALGRALQRPVHMAAVYDPDFHTHVFNVMAQSLSAQTQDQIGLDGQEQLHDEIINDGLGTLYQGFLEQARQRYRDNHVRLTHSLLTGKPYCALNTAADTQPPMMIVIGRHGHHRESVSRLGSNAEGLLRTTSANVLLVGGVDAKPPETKAAIRVEQVDEPGTKPAWDPLAQERLKRVPSFVRSMARQMVENSVTKSGRHRVSADDFDAIAAQFGMGPKGGKA
jgi:nucleotide-binding universal stress UspA family protein